MTLVEACDPSYPLPMVACQVTHPPVPSQGLAGFGTGFLSRLEGAQCPARLLEEVTIIDTPGVLAGEKQVGG